MKRKYVVITLLAVSLLLVLLLTGCTPVSFKDFEEYESDYQQVADFLSAFYGEQDTDEKLVVNIKDNTITYDGTAINDESLAESVDVISEKFTYAELHKGYIVFWRDETGYYGLMWSDNPKDAIAELKTRSRSMDSVKVTSEWYEVGVALGSI